MDIDQNIPDNDIDSQSQDQQQLQQKQSAPADHSDFDKTTATKRFSSVDPVTGKPTSWKTAKAVAELLTHMTSGSNIGRLMGGETGIGKTSFIKTFSKLVGIPVVVVEVPHLIEEEIISIPFIVFKNGETTPGKAIEPAPGGPRKNEYAKVKIASSRLVTKLGTITQVPNEVYLQTIQNDPYLFELYNQVKRLSPRGIDRARAKFSKILFFDEYLRNTPASIRNMLRDVLNRQLGTDELPHDVYITYASNMFDREPGSIDSSQSAHATFRSHDYSAPSVKEWLHHMTTSNDIAVPIKNAVVSAFEKHLTDEAISVTASGVRASPRRWSEIFLYLNSMFPFKTPADVAVMYTTLSRQLKNSDGVVNEQASTCLDKIVTQLGVSSGFKSVHLKTIKATEWRAQVAQSIYSIVASKGARKYVPVVQGPPGIGKTAMGEIFEEDYNMRFIPISCNSLSVDNIAGIPLPNKYKDDEGEDQIDVDFSAPQLYLTLETKMKQQTEAYRKELIAAEKAGKIPSASAAFSEWESQPYRFAVFFDEFNRVRDAAVFNSLRRVILNKEFNDIYKLPPDVFCIGAMNPEDRNTTRLTSHMLDAIDLIDAEPSWKDTKSFLINQVPKIINKVSPDISGEAVDSAITTMVGLVEHFRSVVKGRSTDNEFFFRIGEAELYINPRDYDNATREMASVYQNIYDQYEDGVLDAEEVKQEMISEGARQFMEVLNWRAFATLGPTDIEDVRFEIEQFMSTIVDVNLTKKVDAGSIDDVLFDLYEGKELSDSAKMVFYNFFESTEIDTHTLEKNLYLAFKKIFDPAIENITGKAVLATLTGKRDTPKSLAKLEADILNLLNEFGLTPPFDILVDGALYILEVCTKALDANKIQTSDAMTCAKMILRSYREIKAILE